MIHSSTTFLECEEVIIYLVALDLLKVLLDQCDQLVHVAWKTGVLEALDLIEESWIQHIPIEAVGWLKGYPDI